MVSVKRYLCASSLHNYILYAHQVSSLPTGYPPVQMYRVRVNNGTVMSTSGTETTLTVPSGTFSRAGTYMFNVAAVNALGEGVALAGFIGIYTHNKI